MDIILGYLFQGIGKGNMLILCLKGTQPKVANQKGKYETIQGVKIELVFLKK